MVIADLAAIGDDNILDPASADAAYRKEQLRKLQDEVIELEDVRAGVSITDLGLNDFRMDLLGYIKEHGDLDTPPEGSARRRPGRPGQGTQAGRHLRAAQRGRRREHRPRQPPPPALPRLPRRRRQRDRRPHRGEAPARPDPCRLPPVRRTSRCGHACLQRGDRRRRRDGQVLRTAHRGHPVDDRGHRRTRPRQPLHRRPNDSPQPGHRRRRRLRADRLPRRRRSGAGRAHDGASLPVAESGGVRPGRAKDQVLRTQPVSDQRSRTASLPTSERITWAYKLAESTINLPGSVEVPRSRSSRSKPRATTSRRACSPRSTRRSERRSSSRSAEGRAPTEPSVWSPPTSSSAAGAPKLGPYFSTDWQPASGDRVPLPTAIDLTSMYTALLQPLTPVASRAGENVSDVVGRLTTVRSLEREIAALERKLRNEPQLNRKVELRRTLKTKQARSWTRRARPQPGRGQHELRTTVEKLE